MKKKMKWFKLTKEEQQIEREAHLYKPVTKEEMERYAAVFRRFRKDAVLNIRVNSMDLEMIKKKAKRLGVPYQRLISDFLHHLAI